MAQSADCRSTQSHRTPFEPKCELHFRSYFLAKIVGPRDELGREYSRSVGGAGRARKGPGGDDSAVWTTCSGDAPPPPTQHRPPRRRHHTSHFIHGHFHQYSNRVRPSPSRCVARIDTFHHSNPVRAAFLSSLEAQLATTRHELTEQYKIQSSNSQRLLALTDNLRQVEERSREEREELSLLRREVEGLREKAGWHKEVVLEKERQLLVGPLFCSF